MVFFDADIVARRSSRSSGTLATPMFGSLVANAYGAASAPPPVSALYSELFPALGRPTRPKRSMGRSRYRLKNATPGTSGGLLVPGVNAASGWGDTASEVEGEPRNVMKISCRLTPRQVLSECHPCRVLEPARAGRRALLSVRLRAERTVVFRLGRS